MANETQPIPHSISAANEFRRCQRAYYNRYILGWREIADASWLKYGTAFDGLLEVQDQNNLQVALERIPEFFPDPYDQIDSEVILRLFDKEFGHDPLVPVDLHGKQGNQYPFYINFQGNPVTGIINMTVSGRIDKVTLVDGELGVMEGKTTSQPIDKSSAYWKKLEMDPQIACYVWGLSKEYGHPVNWVVYQVIRRPSSTANAAFNREYTSKGNKCKYTLQEYRARVFNLLQKPPDKPLMARRKLFISEERKNLWLTEHAQTWQEIQQKKSNQKRLEEAGIAPELAWPRNQLGCDMFGGCPFWEPCIGKMTIEATNRFEKRGSK